ncbi:MAG: VPLPA-CTERM-specific exosortase XrtD [Methylococcaceae bacterium]|nr:VPLPA-CTERM-specific exosortase XrtD [Methylococcaceae bacterium]
MVTGIQFGLEKKTFFFLTLVFFIITILYWEAFVDLVERWEAHEEYSHGFIIPFLTLYFIWQKKNKFHNTQFNSSWWGFFLVLAGLVVLFIGKSSVLFILVDYSFIMVMTGLIWSVVGGAALKVILVPLLMLIFAIPLPSYIDALLSSKLQLLSSQLGVEFIIWCDIPVYLEGNVIDLGDFKLQVVEACNGLRYLYPLMSIGFICAYMFNTAMWKKVLVFLSSIPITIIMNSFRIGVVGYLVNRWGIEAAEGFMHDFEGWVVFMASLALLMIEMLLLAKLSRNSHSLVEIFGIIDDAPRVGASQSILSKNQLGSPFYISLVLMIAVVILVFFIGNRKEVILDRQPFSHFPLKIGAWKGKKQTLDKDALEVLKLSDYLLTNYRDESGKSVVFYIAYYDSQRKNVVPHSPKLCIPGGGWEISEISRENIEGQPFNRMIIKKRLDESLVYYWYQQRGQIVANEYAMKWSLFKDALLLNRTDGALVRISTEVYPDENIKNAEERMNNFLLMSKPLLSQYIPD